MTDYERSWRILLRCMRELLEHIENEAKQGDGISEEMWDCFHAAKMYACTTHKEWDAEAAGRWHRENFNLVLDEISNTESMELENITAVFVDTIVPEGCEKEQT